MDLLSRHFWKFFTGLILIVVSALLIAYGADAYRKLKVSSELEKQNQAAAEAEKKYNEDTYGGKTPEETLALFIDALKKGDTDLASKYFILDEQAKWKANLQKVKDGNELSAMAKDLGRPKEKKALGDTRFVFYIYNDANQLALAIDIARGPNGIWKILDL